MNRVTDTSPALAASPSDLSLSSSDALNVSRSQTFVARYWKLALILFLAAGIRYNHLRQPLVDAFSWRESSTAMMAWNFYHDSPNIFFPAINWSGPEPAYTGREFQTVTFIASICYRIFGPNDWVGRAICATCGVWSVFAMFCLVRRAWDETRANAAALMLAIIPGSAFIDRSFLPDPGMLALTLTTVWLYIAYLQTQKKWLLALTGAVGVLAILTKLPGIVTLVPMIYATLTILRQQGRLNRAALMPIIITLAIAIVPVAAYYAWAVYLGTHYPPYHVAGGGNWVNPKALDAWLKQDYFIPQAANTFSKWLWSIPVIALVGVGIIFSPKRSFVEGSEIGEPIARTPWLFHFWIVGCALLFLIGAKELVTNPWNFHIFNPIGAAFAGQGLIILATGRIAWRDGIEKAQPPLLAGLRVALVAGVVLWQSHDQTELMSKGYAFNSYQLGKALEKKSKPGDTVVTIADDVGDPISIFYSRRRGWVFPPAHYRDLWPTWSVFPPNESMSIRMFEDLRESGADWFGVVANPKDDSVGRREFWKYNPKFIKHVNRTCEFIEKTRFYVIYRIRTPDELKRMQASTQAATTQPL